MMSTGAEVRKLAAVMFADIEGYTSLFQQNESGAFNLLEQHRKDLKESAVLHKGHIVKYYGDGSLTLFASVIESVQCAIELQRLSQVHQIPLRIGIHMGEMIEKNKDVYGDAVNIASRIQSLGASGSVLVSKTVEAELRNHPVITTKSLGLSWLKNVLKPIEVFALTTPGLFVPEEIPNTFYRRRKKLLWSIGLLVVLLLIAGFVSKDIIRSKWFRLSDECIIIPPLISNIPGVGMDTFGITASYILTKYMSESSIADVVPYSDMLLYTNTDIASVTYKPALARRLGADYEVKGGYALEGVKSDTLRMWLSILDLASGRLLPYEIPDIRCPANNRMKCIDEAANVLLGYWKSKQDFLFHYTTDSAYKYFVLAQHNWADPAKKKQTKSYLLKAIEQDPKFIDAWFFLLNYFFNERQYQHGVDSIATLEVRIPELTQRQKHFLGYHTANFQGKWKQSFDLFLNEYRQNPKDLFVNTTGMVMAMEYLNDPAITIQMFNQIPPLEVDLSTCTYCLTRFNLAMMAYLEMMNPGKAEELAKMIEPYASKPPHFTRLLVFYVKSKNINAINKIIRAGVKASPYEDEEAYLCLLAARIAATEGNINLRDMYANRAIDLYEKIKGINLARCYLLLDRVKEARQLYEDDLKQENVAPSTYAYLGIIYAKEGNKASADRMIKLLEDTKQKFDFGYTPYYQARIKAHLGEYSEAIQLLTLALEEGIRFLPSSTFLHDPDMIVMNSIPEYLNLIASNRLHNIE